MSQNKTPKKAIHVTILGAGKLGSHIAQRCAVKGIIIDQIWNRTPEKAEMLCKTLGVPFVPKMSDLKSDISDLYLIAVRDAAIAEIAEELKKINPGGLVAHTSGATPVSLLSPIFKHAGGFYPLMTFTEGAKIRWSQVPACISATQAADLALLRQFAQRLGCKTYLLEDTQRAKLHTAAVFANNFTNHLVGIAYDILRETNLPPLLLHALLAETAKNWSSHDPHDVQTGPAVRHDNPTLQKHLQTLQSHPDWVKIYALITESIQKVAKK